MRELWLHILAGRLEVTLPLWLDAIAHGEYATAKRIMETRTAMRKELIRLQSLKLNADGSTNPSSVGTQSDA